MSSIEWSVKGREIVNCNCAYGCPCQFNALPTDGHCQGVGAYVIDEGHYGDVKLDGLLAVVLLKWPGAIHEGNGTFQAIIDERADERQREALVKILHGEDTEPMATLWQVFATTMTKVLDPLYKPIEFEVDVDARTARLKVPGMIESSSEPIRNPVTGDPHRARIDLPHGFEYRLAEMGSGTSKVSGEIELDLTATYAQLANIHLTQSGVVG